TGVFDEPAIYSTFIMSFCFLRFYLMGRNDWVNYVGVVSIILSLSFAGIVIVFLYLLVSETWDKKIIFISIMIFVVCLFVASFYPEIYGSVLTRLETLQAGNDGSSNLKFQYVNFWLSDEQRILFGNGMVGYYDGKPKFFESAFDLTFIFTTITTYGV
ncbi:O85 family O-antigen polymerase, partial [Escherichia coli]|nr:O85 family O-antigen polymerase [Escherichia coli]